MQNSHEILSVESITVSGRKFLHKIPGVISTGITHSSVTGIDMESPKHQVLVLIEDKSVLKNLPKDINGIKVVYSISKKFRPLSLSYHNTDRQYQNLDSNRYRPLKAGSEITNISSIPPSGNCWVGTIGGFPYLQDGTRVILSNNHIIAHDNPGERTAKLGDIIYQPGCQTDGIGALSVWTPINATGNLIDAGYATINSGIQINDYGMCNYSVGNSVPPSIGMKIVKTGRTSGCTTGSISAIDVTISVDYSHDPVHNPQLANFTGQILTTPSFTSEGDSGSIAVTYDGNYNAVGLVFAGNDDGSAILNPISYVEQGLGILFKDSGASLPPVHGQCDPITCSTSTNYCLLGKCVPKSYAYMGIGAIGLLAIAVLS